MSGVLSVLAGAKSVPAAGPTATLTAATYEISGVGSPASIAFQSDGEFWATTIGTSRGYEYDWLLSGNASDCKLVYSVTSGSFSNTPSASGSALSSTIIFERGATPGNIQTVVASFQIQKVSDSSVLAGPVTITITCDNL